MRRTIFYTQPLFSDCGASITASSAFATGNITGNIIAFTIDSFGHRPNGHDVPLSHDN